MNLAKRPVTVGNMHTDIIEWKVEVGGNFQKVKREVPFSQDAELAKYDSNLINLWLKAKCHSDYKLIHVLSAALQTKQICALILMKLKRLPNK